VAPFRSIISLSLPLQSFITLSCWPSATIRPLLTATASTSGWLASMVINVALVNILSALIQIGGIMLWAYNTAEIEAPAKKVIKFIKKIRIIMPVFINIVNFNPSSKKNIC
jgi:hypothetical protein